MTISKKRDKFLQELAKVMVRHSIELFAEYLGTSEEQKKLNFAIENADRQLRLQSKKEPKTEEKKLLSSYVKEEWIKKSYETQENGSVDIILHVRKIPDFISEVLKNNDIEQFKNFVHTFNAIEINLKIMEECFKQGYLDGVKYLVELIEVPLNIELACTAIKNGHTALLEYYHEKGYDLQESDDYLIYVALFYKRESIAYYLIDNGCNPINTISRLSGSLYQAGQELEKYRQSILLKEKLHHDLDNELTDKTIKILNKHKL